MALILAVLALLVALAAIYLVADGNKRTESKVKQYAEGQINAQLRTIDEQSGQIDELSAKIDEFQGRIDEIAQSSGNTASELSRLAADISTNSPRRLKPAKPGSRQTADDTEADGDQSVPDGGAETS